MYDYDSDFRKAKVGDWVFTRDGWEQIIHLSKDHIVTEGGSYTVDGYYLEKDAFPTAFLRPPACFNAPSRPPNSCKFKCGDRVLVWNKNKEIPYRRYFSHEEDGQYYCFLSGCDKWSTDGATFPWKNCAKWEETDEEK
jgi:hypothetical protein